MIDSTQEQEFTVRRSGMEFRFRTVFAPHASQGFVELRVGDLSIQQALTTAELDMLRQALHNPWGKR